MILSQGLKFIVTPLPTGEKFSLRMFRPDPQTIIWVENINQSPNITTALSKYTTGSSVYCIINVRPIAIYIYTPNTIKGRYAF